MNLHELRENYKNHAFREKDAGKDPLMLFKAWISAAREAGEIEPNAFSLATVDEMNRPENRIVLLKKIEEEGFVFYTNYGSSKGQQLDHHPFASMNFWWREVHRQVRIKGRVKQVSEEKSWAYFAGRPRDSQIGAHASRQSQVMKGREEMEERFLAFNKEFGDTQPVPKPDNWGGFLLEPMFYEFWQGQASRLHDRICFEWAKDHWERFRLWP